MTSFASSAADSGVSRSSRTLKSASMSIAVGRKCVDQCCLDGKPVFLRLASSARYARGWLAIEIGVRQCTIHSGGDFPVSDYTDNQPSPQGTAQPKPPQGA